MHADKVISLLLFNWDGVTPFLWCFRILDATKKLGPVTLEVSARRDERKESTEKASHDGRQSSKNWRHKVTKCRKKNISNRHSWVWRVSDFIFLASAYEDEWSVLFVAVSSSYRQCTLVILVTTAELARGACEAKISKRVSAFARTLKSWRVQYTNDLNLCFIMELIIVFNFFVYISD